MLALLVPALAAVVLSLPLFRYGFLWDDYIFLNDALAGNTRAWFPDPSDSFYRPLPRGLWFGLLAAAGPRGAALAHAGNGLFLIGVVSLLSGLALRLAGPRAGLAAGALFAGFSAIPFLVGWASGCQDLLALLFLLAAAHLELSRRSAWALLCAALALLSKETAAIAFPALALVPWLLRNERKRASTAALRYGVLLAAWIVVHPGLHVLILRGFRAGATGYVGLTEPAEWLPALIRYGAVLLNWPVTGIATPWPGRAGAPLALAAALLAAGLIGVPATPPQRSGAVPRGRTLLFSALLALPPILPAVTLLEAWAPYYVVFAAMGLALAAGVLLRRVPRALLAVLLGLYLSMGVWSRGADLGALGPCERWLEDADTSLRRVREGLDRLLPRVPPRSRLLAAVYVPTSRRVSIHLYFYQALRIWRHDPTLVTVRPDWRPPGDGPVFLLGVAPDLSVFTVDPGTFRVRAHGVPPDSIYVRLTLRYEARGLALDGLTDRGAGLLRSIPGGDPTERSIDLRTAAVLLAADGRRDQAIELVRSAPPIPRERAITEVTSLLMDAPGGSRWDDPALLAFDLAPEDVEVCRALTQNFVWGRRPTVARRFAERLGRLRPGAADAAAALEYIARMKKPDAFAHPAPPDLIRRYPARYGEPEIP